MLKFAMNVYYYETLAKNETIGAARYLEFFKRFVDREHNTSKHAVWLLDDNARPNRHSLITKQTNH